MRFTVVDLETEYDKNAPSPYGVAAWNPATFVVLGGFYKGEVESDTGVSPVVLQSAYKVHDFDIWYRGWEGDMLLDTDIIVGFNITFDVLHLYKQSRNRELVLKALKEKLFWDCQIAEYYMTGLASRFPSLDEVAARYGGTLKDKKIAEYWEKGVKTSDIPNEELTHYLIDDLRNTRRVFLAQLEKAMKLGMFEYLCMIMRSRQTMIWAEINGMKFDSKKALVLASYDESALKIVEERVVEALKAKMPGCEVNPYSNSHLRTCLFGGSYLEKEIVPVVDSAGNAVCYKTGPKKGQPKTKLKTEMSYTTGFGIRKEEVEETPGGLPSVDDANLTRLMEKVGRWFATGEFIKNVLEMRGLRKNIATYFEGYRNFVAVDGFIHPSFHYCATRTGRLSCSKPNLQNTTRE